MVRAGSVFLLLVVLPAIANSDYAEKRVVCYYTNWSVYRPGTAKFSPQNINPYLCTHLIYAFGGFTKDNTLRPFDKYQDIEKGGYAKFTGLKTYNKDLKTLLAIGGWNEGSSRFSPMVNDPRRRREFVKNAVKFLRQNHFDGLDLDWEYPAFRDGGKPRDKDNYADLVEELRDEFERESSKTGRPRLLLTMAVPAGIEYIDKGYDIPRLNEYLDFINLLSYDYHSAFEPAVNHHAPLYPLEEDNEYNYDNELTIDYTINHLLKKGASSEKIILGIPTYGRSYTLFNEDATAIGSPADGPGAEGDATREKGYLAYYEICDNIMKDEWQVEQANPKAMGPYAYYKTQWVGYDDEDIVREKSRYVLRKNLGGIMFWSIDNDDFRGKCHGRPYPLIEAAKETLFVGSGNKQKEDNRPNAIGGRTRSRHSGPSRSASRKATIANKRSKTLTRPVTSKRTSYSSKSRSRASLRAPQIEEPLEEEEEEEEEEHFRDENIAKGSETSTKRRPPVKNRPQTRLNSGDRNARRKQQNGESKPSHESNSNKLTTPEPPTTPDPGSDFKCEDDGFFSHPRDCKKYFWCLDSGPSGLGFVAHQFTCPSGLVFNKVTDSCDYPRNVICPKVKPKAADTTTPSTTSTTTTRRTTTEKPEEVIEEEEEEYEYDEEEEEVEEKRPEKEERSRKFAITSSTTPKPLLYKTITRNRSTTTTVAPTTTKSSRNPSALPTAGRSFSDFSGEEDEAEEDPKVIKELIDLIKKAGGIEQLEKQLAFQERNSGSGSADAESGKSTPATISRSLYERVLNSQSGKRNFFNVPPSRGVNNRKTEKIVVNEEEEEEQQEEDESDVESAKKPAENRKYKSRFSNGPGRTQFDGLDDIPEVKSLRRSNKPQYVTIERHSSSTKGVENEDNADDASSEEKSISNLSGERETYTQRSTSGYVNIRRNRPTNNKISTTSPPSIENDVIEPESEEEEMPLVRHYSPALLQNDEATIDEEEDTRTTKTRYISLNRFRSTTENTRDQFSTQTSTRATESSVNTTPKTSKPKPVSDVRDSEHSKSTPVASSPTSTTRIPTSTSTVHTTDILSVAEVETTQSDEIRSTAGSTPFYAVTTTKSEPNFIDDTEIDVVLQTTISPNELLNPSTVGTIAVVSQPRPFGFPRRGRPTTSTSTNSVSSRHSSTVTEPTSRSKVTDTETIRLPTLRELVGYPTIPVRYDSSVGRYMRYEPTESSTPADPASSGTDLLGDSYENFVPGLAYKSSSSFNKKDVERITKVPVRIFRGPNYESLPLQFPKENVNIYNSTKLKSINNIDITEINAINHRRNGVRTSNRPRNTNIHKTRENIYIDSSTSLPNDNFIQGRSLMIKEQSEDNDAIQPSSYVESTTSKRPFGSASKKQLTVNNGGYSGFLITKSFEVTKGLTDFTTVVPSIDSSLSHENEVGHTEADIPAITESLIVKKKIFNDSFTDKTKYSETEIQDETKDDIEWTTVPDIESQTEINSITIDDTDERKSIMLFDDGLENELDTVLPELVTEVATSGDITTEPLLENIDESDTNQATQTNSDESFNLELTTINDIENLSEKYLLASVNAAESETEVTTSRDITIEPLLENVDKSDTNQETQTISDESFNLELTTINDIENSSDIYLLSSTNAAESVTEVTTSGDITTEPLLENIDKSDTNQATQTNSDESFNLEITTIKGMENSSDIFLLSRMNAAESVTELKTSGDITTESLLENIDKSDNNQTTPTTTTMNAAESIIDNDITRSINTLSTTSTPSEVFTAKDNHGLTEQANRTNSNGRRRYIKKGVLRYRGPPRHRLSTNRSQTKNDGQKGRKIFKKVVRKRTRQTTPNPLNSGKAKSGSSAAYAELFGREVNVQRSPGSSRRRSGNSVQASGIHSSIAAPTTRKPVLPRIYPGQSFRALEDIHDQSTRAQNVEVALADPPSPSSSSDSGEALLVGIIRKKISTTVAPHIYTTPVTVSLASITEADRRRQGQKYESTNPRVSAYNSYLTRSRPRRPQIVDYDYYGDEEKRFIGKPKLQGKLYVNSRGGIHCLDQGNFPHPTSCKKFITCAKMVNGRVVGTEYTCPDKLTFDPVGGICNWSAGLGCKE